ncbi:MAG: soluble lytic murein transglycosylase, partial [Gaiellales bacterium]|nr:soluble lytic murein transglycosylase [Gaiellales bacterium]
MKRIALIACGLALAAAVLYGVFGSRGRELLERSQYPLRYPAIVRTHAHNYDLDPALLAAVIYSESRFRPHVRSARGAIGLMQLLPSTAEGIATRTGGTRFVPSDLDDPELNVRYGAWYLRYLRRHYAARPDAMQLALAAYNAGMANVDSWVAETPKNRPL